MAVGVVTSTGRIISAQVTKHTWSIIKVALTALVGGAALGAGYTYGKSAVEKLLDEEDDERRRDDGVIDADYAERRDRGNGL